MRSVSVLTFRIVSALVAGAYLLAHSAGRWARYNLLDFSTYTIGPHLIGAS